MGERPFAEWTEEELAAWGQKRRDLGGAVFYAPPALIDRAKAAGMDMRQWEATKPVPTIAGRSLLKELPK